MLKSSNPSVSKHLKICELNQTEWMKLVKQTFQTMAYAKQSTHFKLNFLLEKKSYAKKNIISFNCKNFNSWSKTVKKSNENCFCVKISRHNEMICVNNTECKANEFQTIIWKLLSNANVSKNKLLKSKWEWKRQQMRCLFNIFSFLHTETESSIQNKITQMWTYREFTGDRIESHMHRVFEILQHYGNVNLLIRFH